MKAYVVYGVSGSGKSTKAKDIVYEGFDAGISLLSVERDACRRFISPYFSEHGWSGEGFPAYLEEAVTHEWHFRVHLALNHNNGVIISDTLCKVGDRRKLKNLLEYLGFDIDWIRMETPLEVCIERDNNRGIWAVGEDVIRRQWENLQKHKEHV